MLLDIDDFTGKYEINTGMYDQTKLLEYIQIYEERYLIEMFGATLYTEFINDLDVNNYPISLNFQKVFNPFYEDANNVFNHGVVISEGIIQMLRGFVYFEYLKDTANQITAIGQTIPQGENSLTATSLSTMTYNRYNEAIRTYRAIQWYMATNRADYENWNGVRKEMAYWL